mgnify:CR=1 FL=1
MYRNFSTPRTLSQATVDGQVVKVGDYVGFKCDIEQGGQITKITKSASGNVELHLHDDYGFEGGYIGKTKLPSR